MQIPKRYRMWAGIWNEMERFCWLQTDCKVIIQSYHNLIIPQSYHTTILSYHNLTIPQSYHTTILSYHNLILPQSYHTTILSYHNLILPQSYLTISYLTISYHNTGLSYSIILPQSYHTILSYYNLQSVCVSHKLLHKVGPIGLKLCVALKNFTEGFEPLNLLLGMEKVALLTTIVLVFSDNIYQSMRLFYLFLSLKKKKKKILIVRFCCLFRRRKSMPIS